MDQTENRFYREPQGRPPLPPKIAEAIAKVMGSIEKLQKEDRNQHGGYNFASIDTFLEEVRPKCVDAGLLIIPDEESCDVVGDWLKIKFSFTLAIKEGETWEHRPTRTVMVTAKMGAQAFGAAQSYAMKQFMRGLFQIATGDDADADQYEHGQLPNGRNGQRPNGQRQNSQRQNGNGNPPQRPSREQFRGDRQNGSGKSISQARDEIRACTSTDMLREWKEGNKNWLDKLEEADAAKYDNMIGHLNDRWDELLDQER